MGSTLRLLIIVAAALALGGWADRKLEWPHVGPRPDDPGLVRPSPYTSITRGTNSYRPVAPLPWDEMNRSVTPPGALAPKNGKAAPPEQSPSHHKH